VVQGVKQELRSVLVCKCISFVEFCCKVGKEEVAVKYMALAGLGAYEADLCAFRVNSSYLSSRVDTALIAFYHRVSCTSP